jgi:altronate dehydratase small subunit
METHEIEVGADALVMDPRDHVATAIKDLESGQKVAYRVQDQVREVVLVDAIAFGHKLALQDIAQGTDICKYGEVIGRTTVSIRAGEHVHVHNVEGIRGRGDQAPKA